MRITHRETGAPVVEFADPLKTRLETEGVSVHVSITDEKSVVAAFAVAEKI
jgi:phosphopantetheinyl transferase (holo-ACP synthase)